MPPYVSRKRRSVSPAPKPDPKRHKPSLFDALDGQKVVSTTPEQAKEYLDSLAKDDDSSLSDVDSDDFEDVQTIPKHDEADEEVLDWKDVTDPIEQTQDQDISDVRISVQHDGSIVPEQANAGNTLRKGPSKRERQVRNGTHCVHVQSLMFHNAVRNAWLCDKELHTILLDGLGDGIKKEIDHWRKDMGLEPRYEKPQKSSKKRKKNGSKDEGKARDWGKHADQLEKGGVNTSRADPLFRLLKLLCVYWKKRFTITAPGLRKQGYMPLKRMREDINAWKKDKTIAEQSGERIENIAAFRKLAKSRTGSRDVAAQLFTALLRALEFDARMVANLQPAGIGWGKAEEAVARSKTASTAETEDASTPKTKGKKSVKQESKLGSGRSASNKVVINLDSDQSDLSSVASDDIEEQDAPVKPVRNFDRDLRFPCYWTEILSPLTNKYIPVDPIVLSTVATNPELLATFEPRGKVADQAKQVMCYTIAHSSDGSAKDVTVRYLKKNQLPGRTKGYRVTAERIKVLNKRGKVLRTEDYDWFKTVMSGYERRHDKRTEADILEDSNDLKPFVDANTSDPKTTENSEAFYKTSAEFVLRRHLRREEALPADAEQVRTFTLTKSGKTTQEPVYNRSAIITCKTAESWHKEGRQVKLGEQALKLVPMRAVTAIRKREIELIEQETGEKAKQGLFGRAQTEWIIPAPIGDDRVVPRNAFGNIDIYTPSMVPKGAVHIPLKGTMRVCNDLKISYAEACTGFEFGKRMAIPVLTGVVVAEENKAIVIDAWKVREAERKRKEEIKKQALVLGLWRKMLVGLRIVARLRNEYKQGDEDEEDVNPFVRKGTQNGTAAQAIDVDEEESAEVAPGGFLRAGDEDDDDDEDYEQRAMNVDLDLDEYEGTTKTIDKEESKTQKSSHAPMSLQSLHQGHQQDQHHADEQHNADEIPHTSQEHDSDAQQDKSVKQSHGRKAPARKVSIGGKVPTARPSQKPKASATRQSQSSGANTTKEKTNAGEKSRLAKMKAETKSKYFASDDDEDEDEDMDDDGDDQENEDDDMNESEGTSEEQEVVKPRQTTARTRDSTGRR